MNNLYQLITKIRIKTRTRKTGTNTMATRRKTRFKIQNLTFQSANNHEPVKMILSRQIRRHYDVCIRLSVTITLRVTHWVSALIPHTLASRDRSVASLGRPDAST
ncbi:unnamed protein product [Chrysodeixis includens]|uniref:Uncharacterized protein n=1 Tax=Chrysodeixis includens TaxID=689277 RepID=A0A9P0BT32_CHRIL|nr:unnamed protein product [Chrysodeixis includens]